MKKIVTIMVALVATLSVMAQHGALTFVGKSSFAAMGAKVENEVDTVKYAGVSGSTADITIPEMVYSETMSIPSFVIHGASFDFDFPTMTATFAEQTFSETVIVDGVEKKITGTSLVGAYKHSSNAFELTVTFTYGSMPMPITYAIEGYYVKSYTDRTDVTVGGQYEYSNESVTYRVRSYEDEGTQKMDVEVPAYGLSGTLMGDLSLGTFTVRGLVFEEEKGGFCRDYSADGLTMHFKAEKDGAVSMDADYALKGNMLLKPASADEPLSIVNNFQPGNMPFPIVTTFPGSKETGVALASAEKTSQNGSRATYNLAGQRVGSNAKGIVVVGGKKYVR